MIAAKVGHAFSKESCRTVSSDKTTGNSRKGWPTVERMVAVDFVMEGVGMVSAILLKV